MREYTNYPKKILRKKIPQYWRTHKNIETKKATLEIHIPGDKYSSIESKIKYIYIVALSINR